MNKFFHKEIELRNQEPEKEATVFAVVARSLIFCKTFRFRLMSSRCRSVLSYSKNLCEFAKFDKRKSAYISVNKFQTKNIQHMF